MIRTLSLGFALSLVLCLPTSVQAVTLPNAEVTPSSTEAVYHPVFSRSRDPGTGDLLYLQIISRDPVNRPYIHKSTLKKSAPIKERLRRYQRQAIEHIFRSTRESEDRMALLKHTANAKLPDAMIVLSKSPYFERIDPEKIIGMIAVNYPVEPIRWLEYRPLPGPAGRAELVALDQAWELRHWVSVDPRYTALLLRVADSNLFGIPLGVLPIEGVKVRVALPGRPEYEIPLKEFTYSSEVRAKEGVSFVFPKKFKMDAFDALKEYYMGFGFEPDLTRDAHGTLRPYQISRESITRHWVETRAKGTNVETVWGKDSPRWGSFPGANRELLKREIGRCVVLTLNDLLVPTQQALE